jgi:hypothetical protein
MKTSRGVDGERKIPNWVLKSFEKGSANPQLSDKSQTPSQGK